MDAIVKGCRTMAIATIVVTGILLCYDNGANTIASAYVLLTCAVIILTSDLYRIYTKQ